MSSLGWTSTPPPSRGAASSTPTTGGKGAGCMPPALGTCLLGTCQLALVGPWQQGNGGVVA